MFLFRLKSFNLFHIIIIQIYLQFIYNLIILQYNLQTYYL
jgi:hypothetical protein